jgi:hypothetical protein
VVSWWQCCVGNVSSSLSSSGCSVHLRVLVPCFSVLVAAACLAAVMKPEVCVLPCLRPSACFSSSPSVPGSLRPCGLLG